MTDNERRIFADVQEAMLENDAELYESVMALGLSYRPEALERFVLGELIDLLYIPHAG